MARPLSPYLHLLPFHEIDKQTFIELPTEKSGVCFITLQSTYV